jgi:hypothetical protein
MGVYFILRIEKIILSSDLATIFTRYYWCRRGVVSCGHFETNLSCLIPC